MSDIQARLIQAFQIEHRDYLAGIRVFLDAAVEAAPAPAALEEAFRQAHSLKGAARAVGLAPAEQLADRLETLLDRARQQQTPLGAEAIQLARAALDMVEDVASSLTGEAPPVDPAPMLAELDRYLGAAPPRRSSLPVGAPVKLSRPNLPTPPVPGPAPADSAAGTLRMEAVRLDRILETTGELLTESKRWEDSARQVGAMADGLRAIEEDWRELRRILSSHGADTAVAERLDRRLRSLTAAGRTLRRSGVQSAQTARQLGGGLRDDLADARMVQVEAVFGTTRSLVRSTASDLGVQAEITVEGLGLRADRLVLQRLKDPVLHLLRNALSHGIESAAERRAKGKPEAGHLSLTFRMVAGRLEVCVADDGRGFDLRAVRAAAERRGLLSGRSDTIQEEELLRLIFRPGFTTRAEVSDMAGRGMGLSVVWEAALRLGGTVRAQNRPEGGAEFRITVPVSGFAQTVLLAMVKDQIFGIPADGVARLHRIRPSAIEMLEGRPVVRLDGEVLPLSSLASVLGMPGAQVQTSRSSVFILVVRAESGRAAFACDGFVGLRQGLVRDLGHPLPTDGAVSGGMVLDDGRVALVLNPYALLGADRRTGITLVERPETPRTPVVLVVDDSLTTRTLEKSILEAHGYQVLLAVDGMQALQRLRSDRIDLVIADVQMPHLDGFGLVETMKQDPELSSTPVILVTSLAKREDRQRGLALGADAYIVKQRFEQAELLATIRQLI